MLLNDQRRYGLLAQSLHWLTAGLILVMLPLGFYMADLPIGQQKFDLYQFHKSLGLTILLITLLRLGWRAVNRPPPLPAPLAGWERAAARWTHAALYALLIAQPLVGFLHSNAANFPVVWWGIVPLPALIGASEPLAGVLVSVHAVLGIGLALVLVLHIGAALRHHFIKRNDVLRRMLPGAGVAALVLLTLASPVAAAPAWTVLETSRLGFVATQQGQPVEGRFETFQAAIAFAEDELATSRIEVTIQTASATMGQSERDQAIRSSALLAVEEHPVATFVSDEIGTAGEGYEARGRLTIRGVTKEVVLPFSLVIEDDPADPAAVRARAEGELTIARLDFGVGQGDFASTTTIGNEVVVRIEIDASRPR